jgi:serine/threonine-protein kinase
MPLAEGEVFAEYTVVGLLGCGGMGEVYLVQHPRMPRREALKILPASVSADPEFRARFIREADLAATLWHPHIVGVHDRGEFEGQLWIAMDYVDGPDTAQLLHERFRDGMSVADACEMVSAVAEAVDYAHGSGLLHRDIKPANVLTSQPNAGKRRILLSDFGIARRADDISGLTATNMTVGTVNYAAPEQLMGETIDGRADQYALAATAFHWLTGSAPFENSNPAVIISRHLNASPPRLAPSRPDLAGVDDVLAKALAKQPDKRFSSCTDFANALTEAVHGRSNVHSAPTESALHTPVGRRRPTGKVVADPDQRPVAHTWMRATILVPVAFAILLVCVLAVAIVAIVRTHDESSTARSTMPSATASSASTTPLEPPTAAAPAPPPAVLPPPSAALPAAVSYAIPACYSSYDPPTERPTNAVIEYCADGGAQLIHMSWTTWGPDGADGKGVFAVKSCQPDCADGPTIEYPVMIHAANPFRIASNVGCGPSTAVYSDLTLAFPTASVPQNVNGQNVNTTYQGLTAIHYTTSQNDSSAVSLASAGCW